MIFKRKRTLKKKVRFFLLKFVQHKKFNYILPIFFLYPERSWLCPHTRHRASTCETHIEGQSCKGSYIQQQQNSITHNLSFKDHFLLYFRIKAFVLRCLQVRPGGQVVSSLMTQNKICH